MGGPQGGFHLWLAIGCADRASPVHLRWGVRDPETGERFPDTHETQGMVPLSADAWPQAAGLQVAMPGRSWNAEAEPPPPKGTRILLWAEVLSGEAVQHAGGVEVVVGDVEAWDPCADDPDACQLG